MRILHQGNKGFVPTAVQNILTGILDILYPRHCFACNKSLHEEENTHICKVCLESIKNIEFKRCGKCGLELGPGVTSSPEGCFECKGANLKFERSVFVSNYDGPLRELIHQYKYHKNECLAKPLGELLMNHLLHQDMVSEIDIVVPIPLHRKKKLKRGFNQSELMAERICKGLSLPISINNLCRIRNTPSQTQLPRAQRLRNVSKAFEIKQPKLFFKKQVLLVDDVLTTGTTASECAKALKLVGASKVFLSAIARAKL